MRGAAVDLVRGAVLEALVVGDADEELGAQLLARGAVVERLVAVALEAARLQDVARLGQHVALREGRAVAVAAVERDGLAQQRLQQLRDGHARRDGVRVDDDVGTHAVGRDGHVPRVAQLAERALLPATSLHLGNIHLFSLHHNIAPTPRTGLHRIGATLVLMLHISATC